MIETVVGLRADLEMLKTAFGNALKVGPVEMVDAEKGYRLKLGDGPDGPVLSPWYPHPEAGGQTKSWVPLSKGEIVGVINPVGDGRQGVILRAGFSDQNPPPSDKLDEDVLHFGDSRITLREDELLVEGPKVFVKSDDVTIESGTIALGPGGEGKPIARIGDHVYVQYGSSKGLHPIVEGSTTTTDSG